MLKKLSGSKPILSFFCCLLAVLLLFPQVAFATDLDLYTSPRENNNEVSASAEDNNEKSSPRENSNEISTPAEDEYEPVSDTELKFIESGYKTQFSGTDFKNHPGFYFIIPAVEGLSFLKITADDVTEEVELDESNFLSDDTQVRIRSLYDTNFEFQLGDEEVNKSVTVELYNTESKLVKKGSFDFTIPRSGKLVEVKFNGQPYEENMTVTNPLVIDVLFNKKVRDNSYINNLTFELNKNRLTYNISQSEDGHVHIELKEGLVPGKNFQLKIGKSLQDIDSFNFVDEDTIYSVTSQSITEKALVVEKVYLDDNSDQTLTEKPIEHKNPEKITVLFNQLIQHASFTPAEAYGENSRGIYLKEVDKATSDARIIDPEFSIVEDEGTLKTKVTFTLVGKQGYTQNDPLANDTQYELVIDENIKSLTSTSLEKPYTARFTTRNTPTKKYTLDSLSADKDFDAYLGTEKQNKPYMFAEGDEVTIKAREIENKEFDKWDFGFYIPENYPAFYESLKPHLKDAQITFNMPATDFSVGAIYRDIENATPPAPTLAKLVIQDSKFSEQKDKDSKTQPGFEVTLLNNADTQYYLFTIDNQEKRVDFGENNYVNDGDSIQISSLTDTAFRFSYTDTEQVKKVKIVGINRESQPCEEGEFSFTIPAKTAEEDNKAKVLSVKFNGVDHTPDMLIDNPLIVDIELSKPVRERGIKNNLQLLKKPAGSYLDYLLIYDIEVVSPTHVRFKVNDAVKPSEKVRLLVKPYLTSVDGEKYVETNETYTVVAKEKAAKPLSVTKVFVNEDATITLNPTNRTTVADPIKLTVQFNQLIDWSSMYDSFETEVKKGVYLREVGDPHSEAHLSEATFKTIEGEDGPYSEVTYLLDGQKFAPRHPFPLKDATDYDLVIDTNLKSATNTSLSADAVYGFTTRDMRIYKQRVNIRKGDIYLQGKKLEGDTALIERGTKITIKAHKIDGKKFTNWIISRNFIEEYPELYKELEPLLKNESVDFTIPNTDVTFFAEYVDGSTDTKPIETEPTKTEPTKTEPTKTEPTKTEPTKTEPTKTEPTVPKPTETQPIVKPTSTTQTKPTETRPTAKPTSTTEPSRPTEPTVSTTSTTTVTSSTTTAVGVAPASSNSTTGQDNNNPKLPRTGAKSTIAISLILLSIGLIALAQRKRIQSNNR